MADAYWEPDMPEAAYHGARDRYSSSAIKMAIKDPRAFADWCAGKPGMKATDDMNLGTYVHARLLEPGAVSKRFAFYPSRAEATKEVFELGPVGPRGGKPKKVATGERVPQDTSPGAEHRSMLLQGEGIRKDDVAKQVAAFEERARGKIVVTPEMQQRADGMVRAVREHPKAAVMLGGAEVEVSGFWTDPETGLKMRCRPDAMQRPKGVLCSVKTGGRAAPGNGLAWHHVNLGSFRQMAIEWDGYTAIEGQPPRLYVYIFVRNEPDRHGRYHVSVQYVRDGDEVTESVLKLGCDGDGEWKPDMEPGLFMPESPDRVIGYREGLLIADRLRTEGTKQHVWETEAVPLRLPGALESRMAYNYGR